MGYRVDPNAKNVWVRDIDDTEDLPLAVNASSVYFNSGKTMEQEFGKGAMSSNVVTVDSGIEKVIDGAYDGAYESCKMYGKTKFIDNDTQEILDSFVEGKNLSLIDVKMPILKNVGKNLFNPKTASVVGAKKQDIQNIVSLQSNTTYTFYANGRTWVGAKLYDGNNIQTRAVGQTATDKLVTFTTTSSEVKATLLYHSGSENNVIENVNFTGVQLEVGDITTPYEDYKTNILETSNEVILRGLPNGVRDTYDCLTGEYIRRVEERDYQESDESDSNVITDLVKTHYELAEPTITMIEPSTTPFAYENGHIILESGHEGQSLLPTLEYQTVVSRSGQVTMIDKTIQQHECKITLLEKMLVQNIIDIEYKNTLLALKLEIDEVI